MAWCDVPCVSWKETTDPPQVVSNIGVLENPTVDSGMERKCGKAARNEVPSRVEDLVPNAVGIEGLTILPKILV